MRKILWLLLLLSLSITNANAQTTVAGASSGKAIGADITDRMNTEVMSLQNMHAFVIQGKAWALPGTVVSTAGVADSVVLFIQNNDTRTIWLHGILMSGSRNGLIRVESGRTFSAGAFTTITPAPLQVGNAATVTVDARIGDGLTLAGTPTIISIHRIGPDALTDALNGIIVRLDPTRTIAVRFQGDVAANSTLAITTYIHVL